MLLTDYVVIWCLCFYYVCMASSTCGCEATVAFIREMAGAPRNPAPRNHFSVWIVKPSGCHCTDALGGGNIVECRPLFGTLPLALHVIWRIAARRSVRHPDPRLSYGRPGQLEEAGRGETAQRGMGRVVQKEHFP